MSIPLRKWVSKQCLLVFSMCMVYVCLPVHTCLLTKITREKFWESERNVSFMTNSTWKCSAADMPSMGHTFYVCFCMVSYVTISRCCFTASFTSPRTFILLNHFTYLLIYFILINIISLLIFLVICWYFRGALNNSSQLSTI